MHSKLQLCEMAQKANHHKELLVNIGKSAFLSEKPTERNQQRSQAMKAGRTGAILGSASAAAALMLTMLQLYSPLSSIEHYQYNRHSRSLPSILRSARKRARCSNWFAFFAPRPQASRPLISCVGPKQPRELKSLIRGQ